MNVYLEAAALVKGSYRLNKGSMEWLSHEGGLCYCAMGAILKVDGKLAKYDGLDDPTDEPWFTELMEPVARHIDAEQYDELVAHDANPGHVAYEVIYQWNDAEERTKGEVVKMLEEVGNLQERLIAGIKQAENGETKSLPEFE